MSKHAGLCFWFLNPVLGEKDFHFTIFILVDITLTSLSYQFVAAKQQTGRKEWDQTVITRWSGASSDFYFCFWRVIPSCFGISSHDASKFKQTKS